MVIKQLSIFLMLLQTVSIAHAINWDAKIDNSNTPISDVEVQGALSRGLPEGFEKVFPGRVYGIHVLLDTHPVQELKGSVVYLSLGLSRRIQKVALELPSGRWSEMLYLSDDLSSQEKETKVQQKLVSTAGQFARVMQQNRSALEKAMAQRPNANADWTDWPDYVPLPSGSESKAPESPVSVPEGSKSSGQPTP